MEKGTIITTFFLNGRVKTFEGKSENDNLKKFLDEYSEATPELFENNNKIISHRYFGDKVTTNYIYKTKEEINNFLDCKFQSNN
mgnify:FL=1|jgi:phage-related tail protein|tara:strand:- start:47 stop:298 length:252 start_codon:yes stop_codon:yes gene_type:complete